jgi:hypothetical protein
MQSTKSKIVLGVAVASACALAGVVAFKRHSAHPSAPPPAPVASVAASHSPPGAAPVAAVTAPGATVPERQAAAPALAENPSPSKAPLAVPAKPVAPPAAGQKPPIQDPGAREALSLVGTDPNAEAYWIGAINDSQLSAQERQDLIEDLNEDGLSDPKHPSPEDLPVILNRLALIEELAPNAMDDVNFDAFREAYKDLQNLAEVAMGDGEPVN